MALRGASFGLQRDFSPALSTTSKLVLRVAQVPTGPGELPFAA